jgi:DNA-binding winged helix-turn-helix (wHTH) protein/Tol biopolymer transport system component
MEGLSGNSFRLGEYLILPQHNKLVLGDDEYKIEPKIMQVLCYLVLHKKEVVSRARIAEEIWPNSVIGLEVVTRAIFELRKILKDDPKKPVYIETIARKGYCFIYDTSAFDDENPNDKLSFKAKVGKSKKRFIVIFGITVGLVLFVMYQWLLNTSEKSSDSSLQVKLLTDTGIYSSSPAMSPTGSQVLFIRKNNFKETENQLVLLDLNSQKQTVINDGSEYKKPKWSKNGNYWLYLECQAKTNCEVIKHDINSTKIESLYQANYPLLNFTLSDNSKLLFLEVLVDNRKQLAQVNLGDVNNEIHFIETPAENNSLPTFNDDNSILYYVSTVRGGSSHLYQYDIISQKSTLINDEFSRLRGLSVKDKKTLWLTGRLKGQIGIWSLNTVTHKISAEFKSLPGHTPSKITSHIKAKNIIYENTTKTINLESAGEFTFSNLVNANSSMIDMNAVYAPKTKALYFSSNRNGSYDLWRFKLEEVEKVTNIQANMIERPIINAQEDKLAFITRAKTDTEMTIFDLTNKSELKKINLPKKVFLLSWSSDQQFIYFSAFENKQYNIYKLDIKTSEKEKFLLNAGAIAQETQDGKYLYYGDMLNGQLMRRTLMGEVDVMFKIPPSDLRSIMPHRLKVINDRFYYISADGRKSKLKYYSFTDKTLQGHLELPKDIYVTDIVKSKSVGVIFDRFSKVNSNLIELH